METQQLQALWAVHIDGGHAFPMIDKSVLREYIDAKALAEETEADLQKLRMKYEHNAVDIVKGSNQVFPYQPVHFRVEGIEYRQYKNPDEIKQLEEILKQRLETVKKKQLDVEMWMNTINPRMQRVVRYKYIMNLTWSEVGGRMGRMTGEAIRKEFMRFMNG